MADESSSLSKSGSRTVTHELTPKVAGALRRYRIASFVVGVGLLILVLTMILKYAADLGWTVAVWGPIHGVLYAVYVLLAFDLSYRAGWRLTNLLKVLLAGVVPVLSFFTEHWVNRKCSRGSGSNIAGTPSIRDHGRRHLGRVVFLVQHRVGVLGSAMRNRRIAISPS